MPLNSLNGILTHTDDDIDLVVDVDPDTVVHIVRFEMRPGKAPSSDKVYNQILRKAKDTEFYTHLLRAFTLKARLYSLCLEDSSPLDAHQA